MFVLLIVCLRIIICLFHVECLFIMPSLSSFICFLFIVYLSCELHASLATDWYTLLIFIKGLPSNVTLGDLEKAKELIQKKISRIVGAINEVAGSPRAGSRDLERKKVILGG